MAMRMCSRPAMFGLVLALGVGTAIGQTGQTGGAPGGGSSPQSSPRTQPGANSPGSNGVNDPTNPLNAQGASSMQDKDFLKEAGQGGNFEVQAGQLATQKGNSEDVKQFGQMMVTDHTKLNDQMKPIAVQAGVKPPTGISGKDKKELKMLSSLNGEAFDKAYIQTMLKDHMADQKAFKTEATNGQIPAVKDAATQGGTVIDTHLAKIKEIAQAHNVSAGGM